MPAAKFSPVFDRSKIMVNMMQDILQYVPYALFLAAIFALLGAGVIYTFTVFRRNDKRYGERKADSTNL